MPLAGTIAVVTLVTAYIPFVGAFVSGAFAVVLALGSQGTTTALIMLVIVILANGALQNIVQPIAMGATLRMNPLLILVVTISAGAFFGMAGMILAAPLTSAAIHISRERCRRACGCRRGPGAGADVHPAGRVEVGLEGRMMQRKPMWLVDVSSVSRLARRRPVAEAVVRGAEVRAALDDAARERSSPALAAGGRAAGWSVAGCRREEVAGPLPDVAGHVVEAVAVRREAADGRRAVVAVVPGSARELALPGVRHAAGPSGRTRRPR